MKTKTILTTIIAVLTFGVPFCAIADDNKDAVKPIKEWLDLIANKNFEKSIDLVKIPLLVGERDGRLKDGKPIFEGLQDVIHADKKTLQILLAQVAGQKNLKIKEDALEKITEKEALKISPLLGKVLPKGGHRVIFADGPSPKDAMEIYVSHEGKIVALLGVER
ncbi:MAG: hypothetical protein P1U90_20640 [Akkermansiaceae bacterium]|nr:hypothetical protein [Akkermansiaceae bacterium]